MNKTRSERTVAVRHEPADICETLPHPGRRPLDLNFSFTKSNWRPSIDMIMVKK
jgi:hypothetical protein